MNTATGIITSRVLGRVIRVPFTSPEMLNINLMPDRKWCIGIDQSTSCTGLCVQDCQRDIQILIDVRRDKAMQKTVFYRDLFFLLKRLVAEKHVEQVVMEMPAPKAQYASRVLQELKGHVEEWVLQIDELSNARVESLLPQVWKSYIVDKSKGKNRSKDKKCIAEDLVDRFPLLAQYCREYPFSDYDSFDACGILNGFQEYAFTEEGYEKVHGMKEFRHTSLVGYLWTGLPYAEVLKEAFSFDPEGHLFSFSPLIYNDHFNLHDNVRVASSNWKSSVMVVPHELLSKFMWKYQFDPEEKGKVLLMFVLNEGKISDNLLRAFKKALPWNEEIFNE